MPRPTVTSLLVLVNLAVFGAEQAWGGSERADVLVRMGAMVPRLIRDYEQSWRLVSASFLHIGLGHLAVNLVFLALLGRVVEHYYGARRFLIIYLAAAFGGAAVSYMLDTAHISAGASGAIFGLIGAGPALWARHGGWVSRHGLGLLLGALCGATLIVLLGGFVQDSIDSWNHVGGLLAGFVAAFVLDPRAETGRVGTWSVNVMFLVSLSSLGYAGVSAANNSTDVADPVGKDLVQYINYDTLDYRRGFVLLADQAERASSEPSGPAAVARVKHEILPLADRLLSAVQAVSPRTPEVQAVHRLLIQQTESFRRALILLSRSASGSADATEATYRALRVARDHYDEWRAAVSNLAEERGYSFD